MKVRLVADSGEKAKTKRLGDWGEAEAINLLRAHGFTKVENLNALQKNYRFADLVAERNGMRHLISVKTRLKYERLGGLNPRYNLGRNWKENSQSIQGGACLSWVAIQFDEHTYSAYFGNISQVEENNAILMIPEAVKFYECLALDRVHGINIEEFKTNYSVIVEI